MSHRESGALHIAQKDGSLEDFVKKKEVLRLEKTGGQRARNKGLSGLGMRLGSCTLTGVKNSLENFLAASPWQQLSIIKSN